MTAQSRGFTLMEVMISLAILAMGLGMLLTAQASSLDNAARARDLTVATLLARSKMIDLEQKLFDEGFTEGETTDNGDFSEEGHKDVTWESKISEIELDLGGLDSLCDGFAGGGEEAKDGEASGCAGMLGAMGGMAEGFMKDLSSAVRVIELKVTWPTGPKWKESFTVRGVVTREDYAFGQNTLGGP